MSEQDDKLFSPISIGKMELPGRIIKTATSETRASDEGFSTDEMVAFYEPLAQAGTPLIITGNIYISPDGKSTPRQMGIDSDDKIEALTALTRAVHRHGSKIFAQIAHGGRQVVPPFAGLEEAVSSSAVMDLTTGTKPRALTGEEARHTAEEFGEAALRCKKAGFDGVQIHGAHGYLVSQFLTPYTNRRDDRYGGTLEDRTLFLREAYRAIRDRVGADFPVILKINGSDYLPFRPGLKTPELVEVAKIMEREGIDAVEISVGHYESGFPMIRGTFLRCLWGMLQGSVPYLPFLWRVFFILFWPLLALVCNLIWRPFEGFNLRYARQFKAALSIPVICVGGFLTRDMMAAAIEQGDCDAISCGRGMIANPFLYKHLRDGGTGPRCVDCNACIGHVGDRPLDCFHPRVRAEKDAMLAAAAGRGAVSSATPEAVSRA